MPASKEPYPPESEPTPVVADTRRRPGSVYDDIPL
jgi:hypothetical protein